MDIPGLRVAGGRPCAEFSGDEVEYSYEGQDYYDECESVPY